MIDGPVTRQCCYLAEPPLRYSQPGSQILYYRKEAELECKKGWTRQNCDSCSTNFGPPGQCNMCLPRFKGDECDTCACGWLPPTCDQICNGFGCCNHSNCQGCIQNGRWEGTLLNQPLELVLTFRGNMCTELVPGKLNISCGKFL